MIINKLFFKLLLFSSALSTIWAPLSAHKNSILIKLAQSTILATSVSTIAFGSFIGLSRWTEIPLAPHEENKLKKYLYERNALKEGQTPHFALGDQWKTSWNTIYVPLYVKKNNLSKIDLAPLLHEKGHIEFNHQLKNIGFFTVAFIGIDFFNHIKPLKAKAHLVFMTTTLLANKALSRHFEGQADDFMIKHASNKELAHARDNDFGIENLTPFETLKRTLGFDSHPPHADRARKISEEIKRRIG